MARPSAPRTDARALWSEPGAVQVAPGVHRIPLPLPGDGLRAVNVYAIEHAGGLALIDSGWAMAASRTALVTALDGLGYEIRDVSRFLVTHVHRDHYSQASVLAAEFGTHVGLGAGEEPGLRQIQSGSAAWLPQLRHLARAGAQPVIRAIELLGAPEVDQAEWKDPDEWLQSGSTISLGDRQLEVLATPGHTRGHVVFVDRTNELLFSGDHVLPHITPSIGFDSTMARSLPLADYLDSLALIRGLPDLRLLPAHGDVQQGVHQRVVELQQHHADRLDAAESSVSSSPSTAYDVAQALLWTRRDRSFASLDSFNQMLAVIETAAHLDLLVTQGRLTEHVVDGVSEYRQPPEGADRPSPSNR